MKSHNRRWLIAGAVFAIAAAAVAVALIRRSLPDVPGDPRSDALLAPRDLLGLDDLSAAKDMPAVAGRTGRAR
jgi:hypothetical protein